MKISQVASADFTAEPAAPVRGYKVVADAPRHMGDSPRWAGWARIVTLVGGAAGLWITIISVVMWALKAH